MGNKNKYQREYATFLRWLADGSKPWLSRYISNWETRWDYWASKYRGRYHYLFLPFVDTTTSDDACRVAFQKAFYYWKRMRYVEVREDGERFVITLTDEGRQRLFRMNIDQAPYLSRGKVLLVLFDIPVDAREARDTFRYMLKQYGFEQLQKSAWFSIRDLRGALRELLLDLNIDKWVFFGILDMENSHITVKQGRYKQQQEKRIFRQVIEQQRSLRKR